MTIQQLQTFNPSISAEGSLDTRLSGPCGTLHLLNESLETMLLARDADFSTVLGILPALWSYNVVIQRPPAAIWWRVISTLTSTDSTLQQVQGVAYSQGEDTSMLYTGPLPRIANVGNPSSVNTSGNTLLNTGNAPGLLVVKLASTAAVGDTLDVTNEGLWTAFVTIAGALHQFMKTNAASANLLQLGNANDTVELLGNMLLDLGMQIKASQQLTWLTSGGGFGAGIGADAGGSLTYNSAASLHKFLVVGNAQVAAINGNGFALSSGKQIIFGTGHEITDHFGMSGTGSGTFGTGAPNNNLFLAFDPTTVSGSSQTIGGTRAASTVVTTGAGLAWTASVTTY